MAIQEYTQTGPLVVGVKINLTLPPIGKRLKHDLLTRTAAQSKAALEAMNRLGKRSTKETAAV